MVNFEFLEAAVLVAAKALLQGEAGQEFVKAASGKSGLAAEWVAAGEALLALATKVEAMREAAA